MTLRDNDSARRAIENLAVRIKKQEEAVGIYRPHSERENAAREIARQSELNERKQTEK